MESKYPVAVDPAKVGTYPALTKAGGGRFYDEVLEYRVWVHPDEGDDCFYVFASCEEAAKFSAATRGAEPALVLVIQRKWINEPEPGRFEAKAGERITEWQIEWLQGNKRRPDTISRFLKGRPRPSEVTKDETACV